MALEKKNRQLCAIVFSDITGYTSLMQKDESTSLQLLERYQTCHENQSKEYNGEIVQYYGDACLMTFPSVVEALKCCHALQMDFKQSPKVPVRIGVHLGDIVFTNDNVFGDAVNIASRVESMGVAGGILFSETVQKNITSHPEFTYQSVGSFEFKNVDQPLEVFALTNDGLPVPKKEEMKGKLKSTKESQGSGKLWMGIPLILGLLAVAFWYYSSSSNSQETQSKRVTPIPTKAPTESSEGSVLSFESGSFTDARDNQDYQWVKYSNGHKWMAENLNFNSPATPCYGNEKECGENGRLYTWRNANALCPNGWRLPLDDEWKSLIKLAGGRSSAYSVLTSEENSGFNATLGGSRDENGTFNFINEAGNYWTGSVNAEGKAGWINFSSDLNEIMHLTQNKSMAYSCRCIEDPSSRKEINEPHIASTSVQQSSPQPKEVERPSPVSGYLSLITDEGTSPQFQIIESPLNISVDADLRIGKRKTTQETENVIISHSGSGFVYELKNGSRIELVQLESETGKSSSIDADLKIAKKKNSVVNRDIDFANRSFVFSSQPVDIAEINSALINAENLDQSYAILKKHFGNNLISTQDNVEMDQERVSYSLNENEIVIATLSPQ